MNAIEIRGLSQSFTCHFCLESEVAFFIKTILNSKMQTKL